MGKVKITSNPYTQEIHYQEWNGTQEKWMDITVASHANSKLIGEELKNVFFPFKVKRIVDVIIKEYKLEDAVDIVFEGTTDEYVELINLCSSEEYKNQVNVIKGDIYLENARDILPNIRELYRDRIYPLVNNSVSDMKKIERDLEKFTDASNDIIPVCVLGTYSSGKSTFINSLIGAEILPSAERPTTAKIYKVIQSEQCDKASVKFIYDEETVTINFIDDDFIVNGENNSLVEDIKKSLKEREKLSLYEGLKISLELINEFEREVEKHHIHDLIEIRVPFKPGMWTESKNKFVIFDTPGSNSDTNRDHLEVLKKAMEGLTNGIPVFVTKYDQLDTTDNMNLYEEINKIKELDTRFTMIIVNKADTSSLPKEGFSERDKKELLAQAVPKKMFSNGIFFVSSIMGLGSKNDGDFTDEHSAEIFEDNKTKYSDSSSRFYKTLYRYNIMPEQLKIKSDQQALECKNAIFANSGLFSVEDEIQTFANKYAAYNKCEQSKLFLGKIINYTAEEINNAKARKEESKKQRIESLKEDKKILISKIDAKEEEKNEFFIAQYPLEMEKYVVEQTQQYSEEEVKAWNETLTKKYATKMGYEKEVQDVKDAVGAIAEDVKQNVTNLVNKASFASLKKIGQDLIDDIKEIADEVDDWNQTRIKVDRDAGEKLLLEIEKDFNQRFAFSKSSIENKSKDYWEKATKEIKRELAALISGSSELTEEKRKELAEIVMTYVDIDFKTNTEEMFDKARFQRKFNLFGETGKLYLGKVTKTYNTGMRDELKQAYSNIKANHECSFVDWLEVLINRVEDKIVDFSPELHAQSQKIAEETQIIKGLIEDQNKLNSYSNEIKTMMSWKE